MKSQSLSLFASFVSRFPLAWQTFASVADETAIVSFSFEQSLGSWVLVDADGGRHSFREYRDSIVALTSDFGSFVFVDGEAVKL
jgi:hypothetical protein